jgi:hypothetical protein
VFTAKAISHSLKVGSGLQTVGNFLIKRIPAIFAKLQFGLTGVSATTFRTLEKKGIFFPLFFKKFF